MTKFNSNFIKYPVIIRVGKICLFVLFILTVFFYPQKSEAASLFDIAKEFINRVNPVYDEKKSSSPMDQIPDGGTLLLRPRSEKFFFGEDIYAIKSNNEIFLELSDFINVLNFSIDYDDETGSGSGFFLREDWEIDFDLKQKIVTSRGKQLLVSDQEILLQDDLIFISTDSLAKWFDLILEVNIQRQILDIESPFPFPSIAKLKREKNFRGRSDREFRVARLPRLEQPKSNFDINTVDVSLGNRIQRNQLGDVTTSETANIYAQGEFLEHNGFIFASGDDRNYLQNVRGRLFKRSEDPDLLGFLNARSYSFGDIEEVRIPLTSESDENFGFRFTNSTLENTDFATTDIEGSAFPGWDVQLYREGVLTDSQTVGPDGRYIFQEIQLFAGTNDFELFFFGPQGEIRAKSVSAPVSAALLASQNNTYEVSVALQDAQTYREKYDDDEDTFTPNVTVKYNKLIGDNHLAYLGFRTRQVEGDRKYFLSTGATSTLGETLLDTNFAFDQDGEASAQTIVRRNLLGWATSIRTRLNTDNFKFQETANNTLLEVAINAQKLLSFGGFKGSLLVDSNYRETADNLTLQNYSFAIANNFFDTSISNRLRYENNEILDADTDEKLKHILSIRKNFGRFFLNLGSTYAITPDSELENIRAQLNYRHSNNFSTDLTYDRQFRTDMDIYRLNANYLHDKFRLSPFIQYSSDNNVAAGINLNFSMYDVPNSYYPDFTNKRLSGRGGMSAFVYHDKDGNEIFDNDDEPLGEALVESITSRRRASSDEEGYATIYDLPVTQATDITLKADSLPDPFMLPATEGKSILPVEGTFYNMEFPVHMTGEIDGTVFYFNDDKSSKIPVGYNDIMLISLNEPTREAKVINVERDGYYVAYMIRPGDYLVVPVNKRKYGNTLPQMITIGYDGPIINDIDVELLPDGAYVPYEVTHFQVSSKFKADEKYRRILKIKKSGVSALSRTINSFIIDNNNDLYNGLVEVNEIEKDNGDFKYYVGLATEDLNDPEFLHNRCQQMQKKSIDCSIMINAVAFNDRPLGANASVRPKQ